MTRGLKLPLSDHQNRSLIYEEITKSYLLPGDLRSVCQLFGPKFNNGPKTVLEANYGLPCYLPLTVARLLYAVEVALQHTGGYQFLPNTPLNKPITDRLNVVVPNIEEQTNLVSAVMCGTWNSNFTQSDAGFDLAESVIAFMLAKTYATEMLEVINHIYIRNL